MRGWWWCVKFGPVGLARRQIALRPHGVRLKKKSRALFWGALQGTQGPFVCFFKLRLEALLCIQYSGTFPERFLGALQGAQNT